jgi:hypothetical protein
MLVERTGFSAGKVLIGRENTCPFCHYTIAGRWNAESIRQEMQPQ